jgi:hypothetical protein
MVEWLRGARQFGFTLSDEDRIDVVWEVKAALRLRWGWFCCMDNVTSGCTELLMGEQAYCEYYRALAWERAYQNLRRHRNSCRLSHGTEISRMCVDTKCIMYKNEQTL